MKAIILLSLLFLSPISNALYYSKLGGTFNMSGEIKKGDYHYFLKEFVSWDVAPTIFNISSNGGDLDEAMKIGQFISASNIPVWTSGECNSACVFIYASGVERRVNGKIGLHRPYFNKEYFSTLTSVEAEIKYKELKHKAVLFLKSAAVSQLIINRMFNTNSKNIDYLSGEDANKQFGFISPFYEEWLIAKCGELTSEEKKVIASIGSLDAARLNFISANNDTRKSDEFKMSLNILIDKANLALTLEKNDMLQPYRDLSKKHNNCTETASNNHIVSFHLSAKKYIN